MFGAELIVFGFEARKLETCTIIVFAKPGEVQAEHQAKHVGSTDKYNEDPDRDTSDRW